MPTQQITKDQSNNMVVQAASNVRVVSGACTNNDLCGAASFASTLRASLGNV